MSSTRELRRRIKSVKATRQITKAMELVSTAKMRRASEATLASRPYTMRAWQIVGDLARKPIDGLSHPLTSDREVKNVLIFAVSSDRGLAGSYASNLIKASLQVMRERKALGQTVRFITMGKQLERSLSKLGAEIIQSYPHSATHPVASDVQPISNTIISSFLNGSYDEVLVLYTNYFTMLRQEASLLKLLPLVPSEAPEESFAEHEMHVADERFFIYEPSPLAVLDVVLPRLLEARLYQCLQESLASEHASRRMAMQSASDNASDMIDDLTLTYNGIRQGNITREIAEITSGAAALGA